MFVLLFVGVACAVQVLAASVTGKSWESGLQEAAWLASGLSFPATGSITSPGGIALIMEWFIFSPTISPLQSRYDHLAGDVTEHPQPRGLRMLRNIPSQVA